MPSHDHCGYEVAIAMVLASQRPGRHLKCYLQFDTIRQIRTGYSNIERASSKTTFNHSTLEGLNGASRDITDRPLSSIWFRRFLSGCKSRIGQIYLPDLVLMRELILAILNAVKRDMVLVEIDSERF